jgi:hypothetical protein
MEDLACGVDESWAVLQDLLPHNWRQQAIVLGAAERMRGFKSVDDLMRTLLLYVGKGYGLRETAVRAKAAGLASVSDVAVMKRLRKVEAWWRWLCVRLLEESNWEMPAESRGWRVRAVDATVVNEPGRRGSLWRIHFSLRIPDLVCDHLEVTAARGRGTGESLHRYSAQPRDLLLGDRGYATAPGIESIVRQGAAVIVRLNTSSLPLHTREGERFPLLAELRELREPLEIKAWPVWVHGPNSRIAGRLCVVRKSEHAVRREQRRIHKRAQRGGPETKPETLEYAAYVMVFTTLPEHEFTPAQVLEWYRVRWQIELVFKRLKTLAKLGHLPEHDEHSARGWLYGKLLLALLCQKLVRVGRDISPWGYRLPEAWKWQRVAGL